MKKTKNTKKKVGFPGTFDPFHNGQLDVLLEAVKEKYGFKVVLIPLTIFSDSSKQNTMFSLEERVDMLKKIIETHSLEEKVSIKTLPTHKGCLKSAIRHFLRDEEIECIIRGKREDNKEEELRNKERLEREFGVRVLFMKTFGANTHISSSSIKMMMKTIKDINKLVPKEILKMIFRK